MGGLKVLEYDMVSSLRNLSLMRTIMIKVIQNSLHLFIYLRSVTSVGGKVNQFEDGPGSV